MDVKQLKHDAASQAEALESVRDRLKYIANGDYSCDLETRGELAASVDVAHSVLGTELDVIEDIIDGLKKLSGFDIFGSEISQDFIDKNNALTGEKPTHKVFSDPGEKFVTCSLWADFYGDVDRFIEKVRFLSWAGCEMESINKKENP